MAIRFTYDGNNIDLLVDQKGINPKYKIEQKKNNASSGSIETVNIFSRREVDFAAVFNEETYKNLVPWWSHVSRGQEFSFAYNSDKTLETTIDVASVAGQKDLNLDSTTSGVTGDYLFIRSQDRFTYEIGQISSITTGVSVGLATNLINSYEEDDTCTHYLYFPNLLTLDKDFNPKKDGHYYFHEFKMVESVEKGRLLRETGGYILLE